MPTRPIVPDDFPLTIHPNGQFSKKVRQRVYYFGSWADPQGALDRWNAVSKYLLDGKEPPAESVSIMVRDVANLFIASKDAKRKRGEVSARTLADYTRYAKIMALHLGPRRAACDLGPADFARLLEQVKWGATRRKNLIVFTRSCWEWAANMKHIEAAPEFGLDFKPPTKATFRRMKRANTGRVLSNVECQKLLEISGPQLRAMILLGINGGFGNTDCGDLPLSAIDFKKRIIDWPRGKTGIDRQIPLWPETIAALKVAIAARKPSSDEAVFLTVRGHRWCRNTADGVRIDAVQEEFAKALLATGIAKRRGIGFYSLRRTFRTVADECRDTPAVDRIMGHATVGMGPEYVQTIERSRLDRVARHVRRWLYRPT